MSLPLGTKLKIRAMVYVAGEPIPFFWPMRSFIHHNPLHGLENMTFPEAVAEGERLFHAKGFLGREAYQEYLAQGKLSLSELANGVNRYLKDRDAVPGIDLARWLMALLTETTQPVASSLALANVEDVADALAGKPLSSAGPDMATLAADLRGQLLGSCPIYEAVDRLYGTEIGDELDELVIESCLDFFDEGQSVWEMPGREQGFFAAWREVARRNARLPLRGLHIKRIIEHDETPEGVIAYVMNTLGVPEGQWMAYFTRELSHLHGWSGFVRWRSDAKHYYWGERYPADLVELLAVRLSLSLALLIERKAMATTREALARAIEQQTAATYLRHEYYTGTVVPAMAVKVEQAVAAGREKHINRLFPDYVLKKRMHESGIQAACLRELASKVDGEQVLLSLDRGGLESLLTTLHDFEQHEGMVWLRAMEAQAMGRLLTGVSLEAPPPREKRPFAQALYCIDTRSERIRRHLESVGDYQTFGIAGFFGVPLSFMELGKGSQTHLCPVLLTPKNLVLEMTVAESEADPAAFTVMEKALHDLKGTVLSPFVTVEAIGLLFGFDMIGKTLIPHQYNRWRKHLHEHKPTTHLLLDKLSREQADSILRATQRAVITKAVEHEFHLEAEQVNDDLVRELREAAMGNQAVTPEFAALLNLDETAQQRFIQRLRDVYRINPSAAQLQIEHLARLGFSLDEQVGFVGQALRSIGLTENFSRFILLVGHGSTSENNPYESALDCGACGGNHGLVNARTLAQMANKPEVRRKLHKQGIDIAEDAWFVPALHNTTTDEVQLYDLDRVPSSHVVYLDRLRNGLVAAARLCSQERLPTLQPEPEALEPLQAFRQAQRNAMDWSQVRPEWGLAGNAYFVIGRRTLTQSLSLEGRAFLHSYDYRLDPKRRLLEIILTGPLVVGQWINMEHYFSTVDNERFGSGSKVYHNVAGRFGVMTGNLSDLRTGLPSQTVLSQGRPYHEPLRLVTVIEAPFEHAKRAIEGVVTVKFLVRNGWIRLVVIDPEQGTVHVYDEGEWTNHRLADVAEQVRVEESTQP